MRAGKACPPAHHPLPLGFNTLTLWAQAHPEGEVVLTRAAHEAGVIQMCPTLASCTIEEMTAAAKPGQVQFYQLCGP